MYLPSFVDDRQKGFMKGRLGTDNLILLEAVSLVASRSSGGAPATVLLDILAAFPSVAHRYLSAVLHKFLGDNPPLWDDRRHVQGELLRHADPWRHL